MKTPASFKQDVSGFTPYLGSDEATLGAHSMAIVGFIDPRELLDGRLVNPEGGLFIVKYSWGRCSGDGGYYYVDPRTIRDYAHTLVALTAVN